MEQLQATFERCNQLMNETKKMQEEIIQDLDKQSPLITNLNEKYCYIDQKIQQTEIIKQQIQLSFLSRQWLAFVRLIQQYIQLIRDFSFYMFSVKQNDYPEDEWQIYDINPNSQDTDQQYLPIDQILNITSYNNQEFYNKPLETIQKQTLDIPQQQLELKINNNIILHSSDYLVDELIQKAEVLNYLSENIKNRIEEDNTQLSCIDFSYQRYVNLKHLW